MANLIYQPHFLYSQFIKWIGIDDNISKNYYIINSSLYAVEEFIKNRYDIIIRPTNLQYKYIDSTSYLSLPNSNSKVLDIYSDGELLKETLNYFTSDGLIQEVNNYTVKNKSIEFEENESNILITYLSGYFLKEYIDYYDYSNETVADPTAPVLKNLNDIPIGSSLVVDTPIKTIRIYGYVGANIYVNDFDSGFVIPADGYYEYSLDTSKNINTYKFTLYNPLGSEDISKPTELIIINSNTYDEKLVVVGHSKYINDSLTGEVIIYLSKESEVFIDNVSVGTYPFGLSTINLPVKTDDSNYYFIHTTSTNNYYINTLYSSAYTDDFVKVGNIRYLSIPYFPFDLLTSIFRLSYIMFDNAINKTQNVTKSNVNSESINFNEKLMPSDIENILYSYISFNKD
jgi:hypothetical protein